MLETQKTFDDAPKSKTTRELLDAYVGFLACGFSSVKKDFERNSASYGEEKVAELTSRPDYAQAVAEKDKELSEKASKAGIFTKAAYALKVKDDERTHNDTWAFTFGVLGVGATVLAASGLMNDPASMTGALGVSVLGTATLCDAVTLNNARRFFVKGVEAFGNHGKQYEYAKVKRAQVALNILKKNLKDEQKKAATKDRAARLPQLAEFYARFGGPSGGMVHNDKPEAAKSVAMTEITKRRQTAR